jgi:S1-C subfamily serine protease
MKRLALLVVTTVLLGAAAARPAAATDALQEVQQRIIAVSREVSPSVVHIEAAIRANRSGRLVTGSGFLTDPSGVVLTNWHVVDRARKVSVLVPGRTGRYPAEVVGSDKQTDVAVLRIEPRPGEPPFEAVALGDSDALTVGEWVVAIGNPYGLEGTVSLGIVSGKGRDLNQSGLLNDFIQTDAMIDYGSSGGPLINLRGEVVGVNSRGQGRGIGFTIPINTARRVAEDLLQQGRIARGYLGVTLQPLDRELAAYWGLDDVQGAVVGSVAIGSPAQKAGIRVGEIITALDGDRVVAEKDEDLGDFQRRIARMEVGRRIELDLLSKGEKRRVGVELASQPKVVPDEQETEYGFTVQELTEQLYGQHRPAAREGVLVSFVDRGSEAAEADMDEGDLIVAVDERVISNIDDFRSALRELDSSRPFLVRALRGYETRFMLIAPGSGLPTPPRGASAGGPATDATGGS